MEGGLQPGSPNPPPPGAPLTKSLYSGIQLPRHEVHPECHLVPRLEVNEAMSEIRI
jgi:hypothetical protein